MSLSLIPSLNKKYEFKIQNISELNQAWKTIIDELFTDQTLCLLEGPVGAGKTESMKQICALYGFSNVASPSFAIHHRYENSQGQVIDHVDLYRLESEDDLESTGFWDLFAQDQSWVFVEWANLIDRHSWPLNWKKILVQIELTPQKSSQDGAAASPRTLCVYEWV